MSIFSKSQRDVARIATPSIARGMTDAHRVRPLVEPGDWAAIDGTVEHYDNHGKSGASSVQVAAGQVAWLTALKGNDSGCSNKSKDLTVFSFRY